MIPTIDGHTQIFGILGHPVGHSLSPRIHNAAFLEKRINAVYVPFDREQADASLKRSIVRLGIRGLSVTIPHKAWAARAADTIDDLSRLCGAANTLVLNDNQELSAHNTDGAGAVRALRENAGALSGKRVLLIGYGGSATAIAHALLLEEKLAMLCITGRNSRKANRFREALKESHKRKSKTMLRTTDFQDDLVGADIDIVIHTTPLGMLGQPQELPLPPDFLEPHHCVFDIVYNPARTTLLKHAIDRKARTIPGYLMLLYQAVLQFELFTGQKAPEHLMERELLAALRPRNDS